MAAQHAECEAATKRDADALALRMTELEAFEKAEKKSFELDFANRKLKERCAEPQPKRRV